MGTKSQVTPQLNYKSTEWMALMLEVRTGKMPTNDQCIGILKAIRDSRDIDTAKVMFHDPTKRGWEDVKLWINAVCKMIRDKNKGHIYQNLVYQTTLAQSTSRTFSYTAVIQAFHLNMHGLLLMTMGSRNFRNALYDVTEFLKDVFAGFEQFSAELDDDPIGEYSI
jgi:hypothetical protein